jgi:hypothetical protein
LNNLEELGYRISPNPRAVLQLSSTNVFEIVVGTPAGPAEQRLYCYHG